MTLQIKIKCIILRLLNSLHGKYSPVSKQRHPPWHFREIICLRRPFDIFFVPTQRAQSRIDTSRNNHRHASEVRELIACEKRVERRPHGTGELALELSLADAELDGAPTPATVKADGEVPQAFGSRIAFEREYEPREGVFCGFAEASDL